MRKTLVHCFVTALIALAAVQPATAQDDKMKPIAIPAQPSAIPLGTGALPTPVLPGRAKATGAAVIVAPGGGFRTLSMQNEGWDVAKALAARGIAAFVLKYRLNQTPASMEEFDKSMKAMFSGAASRPRPSFSERMANLAPQIADARAAFALVRAHSDEWKIDPKRVGMVGFSAGAMLTMASTLGGV